ncbi:hypothetical protein MUK42_25890 [Musa troglodytarum]|uniref:HMA domain-containing protein n=1 Tax=Musa troglodytarum TaxID=320322 RepID=A0A9E7EBQ1_9LILI|nr:hypothetical protein MUK42_25890 [Musa troglodytarum]URD74290.1 hypothetical protein MUK42_25890 [Musa troglodytarum]
MAEKISTLILKVNLGCRLCYEKIRKTLCKLQDKENIKSISYDEKNGTVTISGPFYPHCLAKKLKCKACKVIVGIQIVEEPKPDTKPKPKPKPERVLVVPIPYLWPPLGCSCPYYESYYGGTGCCRCKKVPNPPPACGGPYYCKIVCEEDPSTPCSVM